MVNVLRSSDTCDIKYSALDIQRYANLKLAFGKRLAFPASCSGDKINNNDISKEPIELAEVLAFLAAEAPVLHENCFSEHGSGGNLSQWLGFVDALTKRVHLTQQEYLVKLQQKKDLMHFLPAIFTLFVTPIALMTSYWYSLYLLDG